MLVRDESNISQIYRSRVKDLIGDRSNVSQRWVKYPSDIQVKSKGSHWR